MPDKATGSSTLSSLNKHLHPLLPSQGTENSSASAETLPLGQGREDSEFLQWSEYVSLLHDETMDNLGVVSYHVQDNDLSEKRPSEIIESFSSELILNLSYNSLVKGWNDVTTLNLQNDEDNIFQC